MSSDGGDNENVVDTLDCNRAYVVVAEVLDDVIDAAGEVLYDNYVLAKVRNVALDHVMGEIAAALRCVDLPHDVGERGVAWLPDEDPACAPIDTWGRGAVPTKKKKKADSFLSDLQASESAPQSVGSRARSRRSGRSSRRGSRATNSAAADADAARPTVILTTAAPSARPSTLPKARAAANPEEAKSDEVNELERIQQLEQARIEQLRREQEEEDARYKALQNELKGKEYTFDGDGNLIVIARVSAEKSGGLAHITAEGRFDIDDRPPSPGDVPAALDGEAQAAGGDGNQEGGGRRGSGSTSRRGSWKKRTSKRRQGGGRGGKGGGGRGAGDGDLAADHFVPDPTKQPPLLSTIRLVPGVTLKEGSANKAGPPKPDDSLHMSRSDFQAHQTRLGLATPSGDNDSFDDSLNRSIHLDDVDTVAGGRRRSSGGGSEDDDAPKYYDPNVEMMKSGEWGTNTSSGEEYRPPVLPERPGSQYMQRMELTLGRTTNKPRDRPHTIMAMEPDPANIKLPPIKQVPAHMRSPQFQKAREDRAFGRTTDRLKVTNRKAAKQLSGGQ